MGLTEIIFIASGLSMDACAVSVTNGLCVKKLTLSIALITAVFFGFFQGMMTFFGYILGSTFTSYIEKYDHFFILAVLGFLGTKTIIDATKENKNTEICIIKISFTTLLVQSIATSIDALAAGVSLCALDADIIGCSMIIAAITFVLCIISIVFGRKFADIFSRRAKIAGGIILIIIGIKIFAEQVFFA